MKKIYNYWISLLALLLASCCTYKDIPYFQNAAEYDGSGKGFLYDMTIQPKDELTIFVHSSQPEGVVQFNFIEPLSIDKTIKVGNNVLLQTNNLKFHTYIVDNDGNIDFPVVALINIAGKTIEQANETIKEKIAPYVQKDTDYTVNTTIQNYEVTVMGEVKIPNTFIVTRNKMTVLEALAKAGDMTVYGKRDNVKILREQRDGTYEIHELDLRDANILDSPYYYLQQRDIVYVEPNEVMAQNAKISETTRLWVRGASIVISLGSLLYRVLE